MERREAIKLAKAIAESHSWTWLEPIMAMQFRRFFIGPLCWEIISNSKSRGCNVRILIQDKTGKVLKEGFLKR